ALAVAGPQQSVLDQPVRADQEPVAGKRRQGLVRRVAIPCGTQWQRLPPSLAGLVEAVDPRQRRRPYVADAVGRGQRGDVQQHAGGTISGRKRRQTSWLAVVAHRLTLAPCGPGPEACRALSTMCWASATMASRCFAA